MGKAKKKALTDRQRAFVEHYLTCWNASEAARRAGYKGKNADVNGHRMLVNAGIRAAIDSRLAEMCMSANEVLARLSAHASGSLEPFVRVDADGFAHFDLSTDAAQGSLHLIKKMKVRTTQRGEGEDAVTTTDEEIEIHDPQTALVQLGKYHKLFVERMRTENFEDDLADLVRKKEATLEDVRAEFGDEIAARVAARLGVLPSQGRAV